MKPIKPIILLPAIALCLNITLHAQSSQEKDSQSANQAQFSLQGALDLFKLSSSPEKFEELLNTSENKVNNLDLNHDGEVDYVKVIDRQEGDIHVLTLQVPVSDNENQDIAVIEIEKTGEEEAVLQIIGDEDIFGEQVIIEPVAEKANDDVFIQDEGIKGPYSGMIDHAPTGIIVNVWLWPSVRFIFRPGYVVWISPYHWGRRPGWFHPWRPLPAYTFYAHPRRYSAFKIVTVIRIGRADRFYRPYRTSSVIVRSRMHRSFSARHDDRYGYNRNNRGRRPNRR